LVAVFTAEPTGSVETERGDGGAVVGLGRVVDVRPLIHFYNIWQQIIIIGRTIYTYI